MKRRYLAFLEAGGRFVCLIPHHFQNLSLSAFSKSVMFIFSLSAESVIQQ